MRQDYLSLMMGEFGRSLAQIAELKSEARWMEAAEVIGKSLRHLLGVNYNEFVNLTETDLFVRLIRNGPSFWVPSKTVILINLLKEAGDVATAQYPPQGGYGWYLKALHLLLDSLAHDGPCEGSKLRPGIEQLTSLLGEKSLPLGTRLLLMREFEREGLFGKAKDEFWAAYKRASKNTRVLDFGITFFKRLNRESNETLIGAGLLRSEVIEALALLAANKAALKGK